MAKKILIFVQKSEVYSLLNLKLNNKPLKEYLEFNL